MTRMKQNWNAMSRCYFWLALCLGILWARTSSAEDSPLKLFPEESDIVIRVKAPSKTIAKMATLGNAVQAGGGDFLEQNGPAVLGSMIQNPQMTGVDQTKDWYLVVIGREGKPLGVIYAIPVTDAEAAAKALPERMNSVAHEKWLLYADESVEIPSADEKETLQDELEEDKVAFETFNQGDVSVWVNLEHLAETYEEQIKQSQQLVSTLLGSLAEQPAPPGVNMKKVVAIYTSLLDGTFQGVDDADKFALAISFGPKGLKFDDYLSFQEDTESSKILASHKAVPLTMLSKLSTDAQAKVGISCDFSSLVDWALKSAADQVEDEKDKEQFEKSRTALKAVRMNEMAASYNIGEGGADGLLQGVTLTRATPAAKTSTPATNLKALWYQLLKNAPKQPGAEQKVEIKEGAETYGKFKADLITVETKIDPAVDPSGMSQKFNDALFGTGGMKARCAVVGDVFIQSIGGKSSATTAFAAFDGKATSSAGTANGGDGQEALPMPNILASVDAGGMVVRALQVLAKDPANNLPISADLLTGMTGKTAPIGFSLSTNETSIRARTYLPVGQITKIMQLVMIGQAAAQH